jgi:ABC-type glycerol-3-phosphate transport system substrate-binding protein
MDTNTHRQMFIQGKIGMYAVGPFLAGGVAIGNPSDFPNLRSMLLPFPGRRTMSITVFFGIPKRAVHKEEAANFLMMMLEEQWQKRVVEIIKALPARKGMVTQDFLRENPWFGAFEKASPLADSYAPQGAESYAPEVIKVVTAHVENMLFRDVSAQHAAEEMQAELEKLVASKKR